MEPDKQCARCQNEVHLEYFPDSATAHKIYDKGEVVRIKESVDKLVQRGIIERTAAILNYNGFAFRTVSRSSASDGDCRIRPALLIKPRKVTKPTDSSISSTIVLFATFEGYAPLRSDLPRVLQWFSIPVAPHSAIQTMTEEDHIHTYPEWSNSKRKEDGPVDAWLIAREYSSMGCVDRRWGNVNGTRRGSTFEVDWDTWGDILQSMEDLWTSWVEECRESRGVLEEYQREYLVSHLPAPFAAFTARTSPVSPGVSRYDGEETSKGEQIPWYSSRVTLIFGREDQAPRGREGCKGGETEGSPGTCTGRNKCNAATHTHGNPILTSKSVSGRFNAGSVQRQTS